MEHDNRQGRGKVYGKHHLSVQNLYFDVLTALLKDSTSIQTNSFKTKLPTFPEAKEKAPSHLFHIFVYSRLSSAQSNHLSPIICLRKLPSACLVIFLS